MISYALYNNTLEEGYIILITGLIIVFGGLLLLTLFFQYGMPLLLNVYKSALRKKDNQEERLSPTAKAAFTGEVAAAISAAIHMYLDERHDEENTILTIKKARKMYAPWSSKIYGVYHNRL